MRAQPDAIADSRAYTIAHSRPYSITDTEPDTLTDSRCYFVPNSLPFSIADTETDTGA